MRGRPAPVLPAPAQDPAAAARLRRPPSQVLPPGRGRPGRVAGGSAPGPGSNPRARGTDPLPVSGFRQSMRDGRIPMRIYLNQVFSSFRTHQRSQFSSHKRPREGPRAPRRGVYAGRSRNRGCFSIWELSGCFSTGAAARFRTDRIKRAERFLFYELDPFPRAPPSPCMQWRWSGVGTAREVRTPVTTNKPQTAAPTSAILRHSEACG